MRYSGDNCIVHCSVPLNGTSFQSRSKTFTFVLINMVHNFYTIMVQTNFTLKYSIADWLKRPFSSLTTGDLSCTGKRRVLNFF